MKKILLATTLLAASAGFAAAEAPTVSGKARMGLVYDGNDTVFSSRIRIQFDMAGTTDGGLEFGASIRADQASAGNAGADGTGGAFGGDDMNAGTVFISGAFGKLTFGDNDSAANVLVGNVSGVGFTGLADANELGYLGQTDTSALYEYSTGQLSFALSAGQLNTTADADNNADALSVAVKYSTDQFSVALGYETADVFVKGDATATPVVPDTIVGDDQLSLGASATFGAATVKAVAADRDSWADTHYALSVDYTAGAAVITAFYADHGDAEVVGLGAVYDLGGGASLAGGIANDSDETVADLGLNFKF